MYSAPNPLSACCLTQRRPFCVQPSTRPSLTRGSPTLSSWGCVILPLWFLPSPHPQQSLPAKLQSWNALQTPTPPTWLTCGPLMDERWRVKMEALWDWNTLVQRLMAQLWYARYFPSTQSVYSIVLHYLVPLFTLYIFLVVVDCDNKLQVRNSVGKSWASQALSVKHGPTFVLQPQPAFAK